MQIRTTLCSVLQLPMDASLEYKKHTDSMRDNSSYRNANSNFGCAVLRQSDLCFTCMGSPESGSATSERDTLVSLVCGVWLDY